MALTLTSPPRTPIPRTPPRPGPVSRALELAEARWALVAASLFLAGGILQLSGAPTVLWSAAYLACYVAGGWEPALAGLRALRTKSLDVDLLMIVAAVVAALIGQIFDGALLIVIFSTSGALEALATKRTADSVRALLDLAPQEATRLGPDSTEELVPAEQLQLGDTLMVRPGELIAADADVIAGSSEVDQASITGEPLPVLKQSGDEVFAGTMNGTGSLRLRVSKPPNESVLARIVTLVREASATKAKSQLFIERIEQRYSLGVVGATLLLFFIPLSLGAGLRPSLLRAMTFMIVASPCAVVLATMPPLLSAIATAGRNGVLVKSAVVMEQLGVTTRVAFDKTGTLTEGTPRIAAVRPCEGIHEDDLLAFAASAEFSSEHPLAVALVSAAHHRGLPLQEAMDFASSPGRGVSATVGGRGVAVGSPLLLTTIAPGRRLAQGEAAVAAIESSGHTAVVVLVDGEAAGVLALADQLRPEAAAGVTALTTLTGRKPVLLTGDNSGAANQLAHQVGIEEVYASLLPSDKVARVRALQADGSRVLVVGDGVNDAPALAAADLGLAMGRHGSDLALETADAVIVRDELSSIAKVISLSRRARRLVTANLVIAATVITCLVIWDLVGHLPLPLGVAGHEGSTVIVGLNGLRLLRNSAWDRAARSTL